MGGIHATHCVINPRLAGGCAGNPGHCITIITHHAIYAIGRLVLCPLLAALSSLAAVALAVWPLPAPLAAASCYAAWGERAGYLPDCGDLCDFHRAGLALVGADYAAADAGGTVAVYVADTGGGRNSGRAAAAAIKLQLSGHLLRFGRLRAWLPFVN